MHLSATFVLLIAGTGLLQVNGNWLGGVQSLASRKRSLPNEVTMNGDVKKCGTELPDALKCSCLALMCDGQQTCQHVTAKVGPFRYDVGCELAKPWDQIDTQAATAGRPGDDCSCIIRAVFA